MDAPRQTKPGQRQPMLRPGLAPLGAWMRRYRSGRAAIALIVLASFVLPGIAAVIAAVVAAS